MLLATIPRGENVIVAVAPEVIRKTPGVCGGEACIADRRIAVWMLVNARRQGSTDSDVFESYDPPLTLADLHAS